MKDGSADVNERIANRLRKLRSQSQLSLGWLGGAKWSEPFNDFGHRARGKQPYGGVAGEARQGVWRAARIPF